MALRFVQFREFSLFGAANMSWFGLSVLGLGSLDVLEPPGAVVDAWKSEIG